MKENAMSIDDLDAEGLRTLLRSFALNWLAHDGCWFLGVEKKLGMEKALEFDTEAWRMFTVIEAGRIMKLLGLEPGGGIAALTRALNFRLYAAVNRQQVVEQDNRHAIFRMIACRVQEARVRKGLPDFPCKPVGETEYSGFARTIDPRIETHCLSCPPERKGKDYWCEWEFIIP